MQLHVREVTGRRTMATASRGGGKGQKEVKQLWREKNGSSTKMRFLILFLFWILALKKLQILLA
jgi:hypothetical protein